MRQWVLTGKGVETLRLEEIDRPQPKAGEVLVRTGAVSLNYRDWAIVDESYPMPVARPLVPASDMAGTVVETGPGVSRLHVGDRVLSHFKPLWLDGESDDAALAASLGGPLPGVLAEYRVFLEDGLLPTPASMSDEEASTLPIAALTAWFALVDDGPLTSGQTLLTQGSGGVSIFGIQIAKAMGAQVLVTTGSEEKGARLRQLGADVVIPRGSNGAWADAALSATDGQGVDHVLEMAGGTSIAASLRALRHGGHIALIGFLEGNRLALSAADIISRRAQIRGVAVGHRRSFERMLVFFEEHHIKPVIDREFAFDQAPEAFRHLASGAFGKVVVRLAS